MGSAGSGSFWKVHLPLPSHSPDWPCHLGPRPLNKVDLVRARRTLGYSAELDLKKAQRKECIHPSIHSHIRSFIHKSLSTFHGQGTALGVGNTMVSALNLVSGLMGFQTSWEDIKQRMCGCIYHYNCRCYEGQGYDVRKSPAETFELSWETRKAFLEEMAFELRSEG